jgi:hypothetical protein
MATNNYLLARELNTSDYQELLQRKLLEGNLVNCCNSSVVFSIDIIILCTQDFRVFFCKGNKECGKAS